MNPITCHVLDTALGRPATGVGAEVATQEGDGQWRTLARGVTDGDGRVANFALGEALKEGTYRVRFDTSEYLRRTRADVFFPVVDIVFIVKQPEQHFHIPLLLSPYGYTTYRGS